MKKDDVGRLHSSNGNHDKLIQYFRMSFQECSEILYMLHALAAAFMHQAEVIKVLWQDVAIMIWILNMTIFKVVPIYI